MLLGAAPVDVPRTKWCCLCQSCAYSLFSDKLTDTSVAGKGLTAIQVLATRKNNGGDIFAAVALWSGVSNS
jgi:hypothetical protein